MLKLYAWEKPFMDKIRSIRKKELKYQRMAAFLNAGFYFTFTCTPFLVNVTSLYSATRAVTQTSHADRSMTIFGKPQPLIA